MNRTVQFQIEAQVEWRAFREPKHARWVAICDSLNVTAEADTWAELQSTINEIHNELFLDLLRDGELEAFLRARGWSPLNRLPQRADDGDLIFDLPAHIIPVANAHARAALQ